MSRRAAPARAAHGLAALALTLVIAGCGSEPGRYHTTLLAFGTVVEITLYGVPDEEAQAAVREVEADLRYLHEAWHPWRPGALGRVNQLLPTGEGFSVGPSIKPLIERASPLARASDGRFNPTIGRLVDLWGFHSDAPPEGPPPDEGAIAELVAQDPSVDDLTLDGVRLRSANPAVQLDFGGFAKGMAVDRTIERLRERGIANAMVNAGGDLRAIGRAGDRAWRAGIRRPRAENRTDVIAAVELRGDEALFTSGDYERYFEHDGRRYHHIIDPRTGYPAQGTRSVTVIDTQGARADAAATALFVAGPSEWTDVARSMGIDQVMLIDAEGRARLTPAMRERIEFVGDDPPEVTVESLP